MSNDEGPVAQPVWWDRSMFVRHDTSTETCPSEVDVAGRMRVLVFGPMVVMPAGAWRLTAHFQLSDEAARTPYTLQLIFGSHLAERRFQPARGGRFEVPIDIQATQTAHVALRLWNARAALHGIMQFEGARLEPI